MDLLDRLLEHDRWATAALLDLRHGRDLTNEALDKPFDFGHRTLRATFGLGQADLLEIDHGLRAHV